MKFTLRHTTDLARDRKFGGYQGPSYQERQVVDRPVRKPGFVSDFVVPLCAACAGAALISGALLMLISHIFEAPDRGWASTYWTLFLILASILFVIAMRASWQLLWAWAEIITQKDLDKSGEIGDRPILSGAKYSPKGKLDTRHIRSAREDTPPDEQVEEVENWTPELVVSNYPMKHNESVMQWFVRVAGEVGTGTRIWEPLLGRKRATNYRDALIAADWASWKVYDADEQPVPQHGWQLDADPDEILRHIK